MASVCGAGMQLDDPLFIERREVAQLSSLSADMLEHADARAILEMWNALRGERPVPFRAELDAGRIGARAPFLAILEQVAPSNFRIRIAGDRLNRWFGMELRGMSALSLTDTGSRNHLQATLNRVVMEPAAGVVTGLARTGEGAAIRFEMLLLPMRSDFGRVDRVLVGLWLLDGEVLVRGPMRLDPSSMTVAPVPCDPSGPEADDGAGRDADEHPVAPASERADNGPGLHAIEGGGDPPSPRPGSPRPHLRLVKKS